MPSAPANVHGGEAGQGSAIMQKRGFLFPRGGQFPHAARGRMRHNSFPGLERRLKTRAVAGQGARCQATDRVAAVASSSKALEMSRMLTTPIRLYLSITGRWR